MIDLNFTNEELEALKMYIQERYEAINQMLISDAETDIALLSDEFENKPVSISYTRETIISDLRCIKLVYKLILKECYKNARCKNKLYRGTNIAEIERIRNELLVDKFLIATDSKEIAENKFAISWNRPASMNLILDQNVPYIVIDDIISGATKTNTILIAPFTKVKKITESLERKLENSSKYLKTYDVEIEKQELDELLTERERNGLYNYILDNIYTVNKKLEESIRLEKDNTENFDNIRKLEQLLVKYESKIEEKEADKDYSDIERRIDQDDVRRVTEELEELKEISANVFEIRKENINFVNIWKRNIAVYLISECKEIEKLFEGMEFPATEIEEENSEELEVDNVGIVGESFESNEEKSTNIEKEEKIETDVSSNEKEKVLVKVPLSDSENMVSENLETKELSTSVEMNIENNSLSKGKVIGFSNNVSLSNEALVKTIGENKEKIISEISKKIGLSAEAFNKVSGIAEKTGTTTEALTREIAENKLEKIKNELLKNTITNKKDNKISEVTDDTKVVSIVGEEYKVEDPLYTRVTEESKENIDSAQKLLNDINLLITKQQNHAKIAGNIGSSYSALNNAFDMRKASESLLELLQNINLKVKSICEQEKTEKVEEQLEKISKANIEISTLINYLNNPKIATRNCKVTRFDEMAIIEENELKRGIAEKIRDIRGEAELKKLKDDLEIIEDKSTFSKVLGAITGKNKLDDLMIRQIEIRQKAIRRTLSRKLSLAYNYSIHELMADVSMFIYENEDDELVEEDIRVLKALSEELKRNYIVLDSKVQSIIEEKEGIKLPIDERKLSKQKMIEVETYKFLKKYGYNITEYKEDPKYQDTMANEIARIIEYINSSNIL